MPIRLLVMLTIYSILADLIYRAY